MTFIKVTPAQIAALQAKVTTALFSYQRNWLNAGLYHRDRMITKSRQIGADWTFSLEALIDVLTTGRNQYFIADTLEYAENARAYVVAHLQSVGINVSELQDLTFSGGAKIEFLSNDTYLAGKHGNAYFAEFAWSEHLSDLVSKSGCLAKHKRYRRTYYSSVSLSCEAACLWKGASIKPVNEHRFFSFGGVKEIDGIWRQTVTIEDAISSGSTLFTVEELMKEYSQYDFNMLFMCKWPGLDTVMSGEYHG